MTQSPIHADGEQAKPRFKGTETGQWFVDSVDELQAAQDSLPDYDEFDGLPKDKNLLPYVLGVLGVFVLVFIYNISGSDSEEEVQEEVAQSSTEQQEQASAEAPAVPKSEPTQTVSLPAPGSAAALNASPGGRHPDSDCEQ